MMASIIFASVLLLGGLAWSFLCTLALASDPMLRRTGNLLVLYSGSVAFVIGLIWWVLILARCLA